MLAAVLHGQAGQFSERDARYRVQPSDVIEVHYRYTPEYDQTVTVQPDGFVALQIVGDIKLQGFTMEQVKASILEQASKRLKDPEITLVLKEFEKPYFVVGGEVTTPGRFEMRGKITAIQAIAMAGSWNIGGNLRQVIIFRRDDQWRLMATRVNVRPALYNSRKLEADDIWLRDSDIVIVPKSPLQVFDDYVQLIFTKGIYGIIPFQGVSLTFYRDLAGAATVLP